MKRFVPLAFLAIAGSASAQSYADSTKYREVAVTVGVEPWLLPGTLTIPNGPGRFPVVVLVHGSGPNDRDETLGPNKPFRDIAWGLASNGVAVLRYDKRTRVHGARMTGAVTVEDEVIVDALSALAVARSNPSIDPSRAFVLGHSLGAGLAPEIARRDGKTAGAIVMAGAARPLAVLMKEQLTYLGTQQQNASPAAQAQIRLMLAGVDSLIGRQAPDSARVMGAPASYFYDLDKHHGPTEAARLDIPLLILQGERDYQVTMTDFAGWKEALASRPKAVFRSFPTLNHLFLPGVGAPNPIEYGIPTHVAGEVITALTAFVLGR